jgi:predicted secreted hydrolase
MTPITPPAVPPPIRDNWPPATGGRLADSHTDNRELGIYMPTSSLVRSRRLRGAAVVAAVAATLAVVVPQVSSAAPGHAAASGYPTFVHVPADQAAHPSAAIEWWYTVGHLYTHGHEYGYEVQLTAGGIAQLSITDVTAGKYYTHQAVYQPGQFSASTTQLDVRMPAATLSGPTNAMHLTATLPQGSLDLTLNAEGPVLYPNGTGLFPFLGGTSYYYSLPNLKTSGTLTLGGKTSAVTGKSWLDRQWGTWDWSQLHRWTWMSLQLDNDEYLNLWDLYSTQGEQQWATVLHPDGSENIVTVNPLAKDATDFQTSPTTGQRYAGKWTVEIPSLKARLTVTATPTLQEIQAGIPFSPGINDAAATVTGLYQGKHITGKAYAQHFGVWE